MRGGQYTENWGVSFAVIDNRNLSITRKLYSHPNAITWNIVWLNAGEENDKKDCAPDLSFVIFSIRWWIL